MVDTREQMMGSIKGAAKKTNQMLHGRTGIYATLSKEHGEVAALFSELIKTDNQQTERRQELFSKIEKELLAHSEAEEDVFYNALASHPGIQQKIAHSRKEHAEIEDLLQKLNHIPVGEQRWIETAKKLQERVEHHVNEEENELFAQADDILTSKQAKALDEQYKERRTAIISDV